ncbi:MAG: PilZ domain-containing protein [Terriglobales bacterium]
MPNSKTERRSGPRVPVNVPLTITTTDPSLPATGHTRDLSSNGIFFYTDFPIRQGSSVEMVLILPSELTSGEKRWVCCQATVVRVEENADGRSRGVAAEVRNMDVLPELIG